MRCLVTGGLGFIGSHVVDLLIEEGYDVIVLDNESTGNVKNLNKKAKLYKKDILDLKEITPLFKGVDYVFHLAALPRIIPSFENISHFLDVNVKGTINCLKASLKNKVKKFVYSSSSSVYGNDFKLPTSEENPIHPMSPYAIQKYESELYCRLFSELYNMNVVVLRYFNVYGPRSFNIKDKFRQYSSPVSIFIYLKKKNKPLTITWDGEQKRDYVYVKDVARANLLAAESNKLKKFEVFNIGSGENHTVNEIADIIGGKKIYIKKRMGEVRETLADISKAKRLLGWEPKRGFKEGILETMKEEGLK